MADSVEERKQAADTEKCVLCGESPPDIIVVQRTTSTIRVYCGPAHAALGLARVWKQQNSE